MELLVNVEGQRRALTIALDLESVDYDMERFVVPMLLNFGARALVEDLDVLVKFGDIDNLLKYGSDDGLCGVVPWKSIEFITRQS